MRQRAVAALILGMLSTARLLDVGASFHRGVYLVVFSLAVGIAACWFGITAMRKARLAVTIARQAQSAEIALGIPSVPCSASAYWSSSRRSGRS